MLATLAALTAVLVHLLADHAHCGTFKIREVFLKNGDTYGFRYTRTSDTHLIDGWVDAYAIASPELARHNWSSVEVNGSEVLIHTSACEQLNMRMDELSPEERLLIQGVKRQLFNGTNGALSPGASSVHYNGPHHIQVNEIRNNYMMASMMIMLHFMESGRYSAYMYNLPFSLRHVFVLGDLVGFAYWYASVRLEPIACLQGLDRELFDLFLQHESEIERAFREQQRDLDQLSVETRRQAVELASPNADVDRLKRELNEKIDQLAAWPMRINQVMGRLSDKFTQKLKSKARG